MQVVAVIKGFYFCFAGAGIAGVQPLVIQPAHIIKIIGANYLKGIGAKLLFHTGNPAYLIKHIFGNNAVSRIAGAGTGMFGIAAQQAAIPLVLHGSNICTGLYIIFCGLYGAALIIIINRTA